jgi:hypothetical protein
MKAFRILVIAALVYVGVVVVFESLLGYFQPSSASTLVITTGDEDGSRAERVVARLESDGSIYVAANHWPRAWYRRALENPAVRIESASESGDYLAVPVTGAEHDRVDADNRLGLGFRILTGFPPRYFLRLDPRQPQTPASG